MFTHSVETMGMDREAMFPNYSRTIEQGGLLHVPLDTIKGMQNRVAMRRYIRKHYPNLGRAVRDMGEEELTELVDNIRDIKGDF